MKKIFKNENNISSNRIRNKEKEPNEKLAKIKTFSIENKENFSKEGNKIESAFKRRNSLNYPSKREFNFKNKNIHSQNIYTKIRKFIIPLKIGNLRDKNLNNQNTFENSDSIFNKKTESSINVEEENHKKLNKDSLLKSSLAKIQKNLISNKEKKLNKSESENLNKSESEKLTKNEYDFKFILIEREIKLRKKIFDSKKLAVNKIIKSWRNFKKTINHEKNLQRNSAITLIQSFYRGDKVRKNFKKFENNYIYLYDYNEENFIRKVDVNKYYRNTKENFNLTMLIFVKNKIDKRIKFEYSDILKRYFFLIPKHEGLRGIYIVKFQINGNIFLDKRFLIESRLDNNESFNLISDAMFNQRLTIVEKERKMNINVSKNIKDKHFVFKLEYLCDFCRSYLINNRKPNLIINKIKSTKNNNKKVSFNDNVSIREYPNIELE